MKKIKILHIVSNLDCGGAETMIMNIFRNIDREKFQFDFLCLNPKENSKYENEIKKLNGNIYIVENPKQKIKYLYNLLKENNYDVIHSHVMFYTGFINYIAKKAGVKIRICHSHSSNDIKKETFIRKIYMIITRFLINKYSNVKIACGEKAGKYLYGKNKNFIVLKNGIDLEKFVNVTNEQVENLKKEFNIEKDDFVIGHVGSFIEVKNQDYFIELAKEIKKDTDKFKIVLVGDGFRYNYIKNMIEENNLQKHFIMPKIREDINVFMKMFDIFIMPSLYEGFPLTVVEALAGDNICYLSDTISDETKIIESRVNFFNLEENKEKLLSNIKNDIKSKKELNINIELINKGFSIRKMVEDITKIYKSSL